MMLFVAVTLLMWISLDMNYFVYTIAVAVFSFFKRKLHRAKFMEESSLLGVCLPTDIDFMCHMNNARYLKNCDYARVHHFMLTDMRKAVRELGAQIVLNASNIRYRRSILLFDVFHIYTKVVCWDEKAFYLEQRFERARDKFINAIVVVKIAVTGCSAQRIVDILEPGLSSPTPTPEISKWMESITISSERLRKAA